MIIICNGAFKSGSSWLMNIVRQLTDPVPIEQEWRNPNWSSPSIAPEKLDGFIRAHQDLEGHFVSKNHLASPADRKVLLENGYRNVFVLNITRDIRDVVVSAYYHAVRVESYTGPFESFFKERGANVAKRVCAYNELWSARDDRLHISSYERLQLDGINEITAISKFLLLDSDEEKIRQVYEKTRFDAWKERTGSPHMRKGVIGDWKNHLTESDIGKLRARVPAWAFSPEAD